MKVLLISPPKIKTLSTDIPAIFEEVPQYYPPLGLMYISAYLKRHFSHHVEILDAQILKMSHEEIRQEIRAKSPDIVGITTTTYTLPDVIEIAKIVKEVDNSIHVNLGGPHTHIFPDETISFPCVDSLILGEGEIAFSQLVNSLEQNPQNLAQIKGIIYKDKDQIIKTSPQDVIFDIDSLPYPTREMIPYKKYILNGTIFTTILSSRGCPYECIHCHRPPLSKNFRPRSNSNVVDEIEECVKSGIQEFIFVDDVFTLNRKRVFDICDEIIRRNLKIRWRINARGNNIDYSLLLKLKEAGCRWIHYEVATGTQKMLDFLKKEMTLKQIHYAIKVTNDVKITNSIDITLGLPDETKEHILKTIKFVNKINPDFAYFSLSLPYPGTELYKVWRSQYGGKRDYWQEYANPNSEFKTHTWHQNSEELTKLLKFAYKSFYFRLDFFIKQILTSPSFEIFKKRMKISIKVLNL
ncbi:MAG: radical SAM protein [bacterium]